MKKKYWFGTYHNSYASTNYALNVIKRHTLGDKLYNGEYTVEADRQLSNFILVK